MNTLWNLTRLKQISINPRVRKYHILPENDHEKTIKEAHPHIFEFDAISIGDGNGQAFIVPLDEGNEDVAKLILQAIKVYLGDCE